MLASVDELILKKVDVDRVKFLTRVFHLCAISTTFMASKSKNSKSFWWSLHSIIFEGFIIGKEVRQFLSQLVLHLSTDCSTDAFCEWKGIDKQIFICNCNIVSFISALTAGLMNFCERKGINNLQANFHLQMQHRVLKLWNNVLWWSNRYYMTYIQTLSAL